MIQNEVFEIISRRISALRKAKPKRIAINGIEGTGKTTFAERLAAYMYIRGHTAIHVSIDGFHHDRERRYSQGKDSAKGYYEDSYDEVAFAEKVLVASQGEPPCYTPATHDLESDLYLSLPPIAISDDTIIITDGAYLFKPIYRKYWDLKIYLKTDFDTARQRGASRDVEMMGGYIEAERKYLNRYHAASMIYISENMPENIADMIIDNTDFDDLIVTRGY
jgi:uridine kinase